jgi:hypothetical protein
MVASVSDPEATSYPPTFIAKCQAANLSERSACEQHFLDLCELLGQPKPAAADPEGAGYCFERGVSKTDGGQGWANVWMKDHFGWEYKGKHKDLKAAHNHPPQLPRVAGAELLRGGRCWSSATSTASRFTRTSPARQCSHLAPRDEAAQRRG